MWNGEGFPPVGTVCEFKYFGDWQRGIVAISDEKACTVSNGVFGITTYSVSDIRLIKSAVEIGNEIHEQADWDGKGFPPTGIKCEVLRSVAWQKAFTVGFDQHGSMVFSIEETTEFYCTQLTEHFRPLRTERQIAQEDMINISKANQFITLVDLFGLIHDAGYRKCQK